MKQVIRLAESDLHRIIENSVSRILNEIEEDNTPVRNTNPIFKTNPNYWKYQTMNKEEMERLLKKNKKK